MIYCFHDYSLDEARRELRHREQLVAIEPKVFQVLLYLLHHRDRVVSKAELLEQCWPESFVSEAALTRCLTKLRKVVQADRTSPLVIKTMHGQGYRFVADVTCSSLASSPEAVSPHEVEDTPADTAIPPAAPLRPPESASEPPVPQERPALAGETRPAAERRQLTVLFCDLVGSTAIADQLDPEDFRDVTMSYQTTCAEVSERYGGYIAQYLGDGILVYFGYPAAHEDDAQRAIHAGLAMLASLADLNRRLGPSYGIHLRARVGIHTGLVVVGDVGGGPQHGQLALGATPNIAAKIQALARPKHVVISAATHRLAQGYFVCQDLGAQTLSGVSEPVALYQVFHASEARGRLEAASPRGLTPLVGRDAEMALLEERWSQVQQGLGQVMVLSGEAGIGKSRLVRAFMERLAPTPFTHLEYRGSPYHQHTALYPAIDLLQRSLRFDRSTPEAEKITRLESLLHQHRLDPQAHLPLLASLLSLSLPADRYQPRQMSSQQQRQRTMDTLLVLTLGLAQQQPVLFIVEDLHWIDPSTLEWLGLLMDQVPTDRIFTLMMCRPTFQVPWGGRTHGTSLTINRLLPQQVAQMAQAIVGDEALPADLLDQIVSQTDGVPLFVEEVTKFVLTSQRLHGHESSAVASSAITIPATLQDLLMARLDQMGAAKGTAQLAATIGREFGFALLQAVVSIEAETLRQDLRRLVDAELLYQRGVGAQATYVFKHALIQEAAYTSLLRRTRQHYHHWIAQALEKQFPEVATERPELVAHHYTEAGLVTEAVPYWQCAAERANDRAANLEACSYLTKGLELLSSLPESSTRLQVEAVLQTILGRVLTASKSYGDETVVQAYTRARQLCQQMGNTSQLFPVLLGLSIYFVVRSELSTARELGELLLQIAQRNQDPILLVEAHYVLGVTFSWSGEFMQSHHHLEQGIAHYDSAQHPAHLALYGQDSGPICLCRLAIVLWHLGYPDQALTQGHAALAMAEDLAHPFSRAYVLTWLAFLYNHRRQMQEAQTWADVALTFATAQGFPYWYTQSTVLQGWLLSEQGDVERGIELMHEGLTAMQGVGTEVMQTHLLGLLACAYGKSGKLDTSLTVVDEALSKVSTRGERWPEAELHRLKGELLLQINPAEQVQEAESNFRQSLHVARCQHAKLLELRAAMSLSRLWRQQGRCDAARQLLAEVYDWFTEGFDTVDLQEARKLLEQLA